jgi:dinuclear metal center YbgI/SA1388 family protein
MKTQQILDILQSIAPLQLSEDWDNVGLLIGWSDSDIRRVMTTLDVTDATLQEAIERKADLIVSHHPLPFRPLKAITTDTLSGRLICKALQHRISIYSPHTAWDNTSGGINDQLGDIIGMIDRKPMTPSLKMPSLGSARIGTLAKPSTIADLVEQLKSTISDIVPSCNAELTHTVRRIAICCGSGGSMISQAIKLGVDVLLTGEATYHQNLEASAANVVILAIGHHQSESFAMKTLAQLIADQAKDVAVWHAEADKCVGVQASADRVQYDV